MTFLGFLVVQILYFAFTLYFLLLTQLVKEINVHRNLAHNFVSSDILCVYLLVDGLDQIG